jgi:GTPase SAR1 family protein
LSAGYQRLRDRSGGADLSGTASPIPLESLLLAEAALRYADWPGGAGARPRQIAVIGPTQTGKSTLVNLLLGRAVAEVSPLAGFTVHPAGFWLTAASENESWAEALLPGWQRCAPDQLSRGALQTYALTKAEPAGAPDPDAGLFARPGCVVWDTPDFDSLAARGYVHAVVEVVALADLYLLVLSKEKYSDLSVWHLLDLLAPLARPLVVCLNKVPPEAEEVIVRSLRARLSERGRSWGDVPIVALPYDPALAAGGRADRTTLAEPLREIAQACDAGIAAPTAGPNRGARAAGVRALLRRHWDAWLAPVRAEQAARAQWQQMVSQAATAFLAAYRRDYLDHPGRYDSFRRAAVELLNLLEIPRIGGVIARTRRLVTWPARQLLAAGRAWWDERRPAAGSSRAVHSLGVEATVLVDTFNALQIGLQRDLARRCVPGEPGFAVWQALARQLQRDEDRVRQAFEAALRTHHEQVTGEIRAAATSLYAALQKQPTRLAALRAGRVAMDVGTLLLAVKTGGLTPLDIVWAPAAFGLTSLLMEGAAGLEMQRVDRQLKARQQAAAAELVQGTLVRELTGLAMRLDDARLFGLTSDRLDAAAQALAAWEGEAPAEPRGAGHG